MALVQYCAADSPRASVAAQKACMEKESLHLLEMCILRLPVNDIIVDTGAILKIRLAVSAFPYAEVERWENRGRTTTPHHLASFCSSGVFKTTCSPSPGRQLPIFSSTFLLLPPCLAFLSANPSG